MLRKYVTSMNREQFDRYGERMLRTFSLYWPKGQIEVYTEDGELPLKDDRIEYKYLFAIPGLDQFLGGISYFPIFRGDDGQRYNYRFNVNAFARKAYAQMAAAQMWNGHLFWIDADVVTSKHIPAVFLDKCMEGAFIAYMKRKTWHVCSSFVGWDCAHAFSRAWWENYHQVYQTGKLFALEQWDDAFVLEKVCEGLPATKDIAETITGEGPYNVFDAVFAGYAKHLKGALKNSGPNRYQELLRIVREAQPKRLIEIGTWNGNRAIEFAAMSPGMEYIGLDLFETASDETDAAEKNVKKHHSASDVSTKLTAAGVKHALYRGDSKEQMTRYLEEHGHSSVDLIYIDGGHSVETIEADLNHSLMAIKPGGLIVMDDYYTDMPPEDLKRFGAQEVLRHVPHTLVPVKDPVVGGGFTQLAVIQC